MILDTASTPSQRRSGTARVVKGSHSFTHAFIYEWNVAYVPLPFKPKLELICRVGLSTIMVSKQSAKLMVAQTEKFGEFLNNDHKQFGFQK